MCVRARVQGICAHIFPSLPVFTWFVNWLFNRIFFGSLFYEFTSLYVLHTVHQWYKAGSLPSAIIRQHRQAVRQHYNKSALLHSCSVYYTLLSPHSTTLSTLDLCALCCYLLVLYYFSIRNPTNEISRICVSPHVSLSVSLFY